MAEFLMPALGADMETGTVVQWLVRPGAQVKSGDVVAVVETHKGAIDVECFLDGTIEDLAPVGQSLPVGAVLAHVRAPGERRAVAAPGIAKPAMPTVAPAKRPARAPRDAAPPAVPVSPPAAAAPAVRPAGAAPVSGVVTGRPAAAAGAVAGAGAGAGEVVRRGRVSPAARRRAAELGLDAQALHGTGADGAVTLADVELAARAGRAAAARAPAPMPPARPGKGGFDAALMRKAIASAMTRSKREIPHYYLGTAIDFGAAQAWLDTWNASRDPGERLLPAALLLKAAALALRGVPQLNGFFENDAYHASERVHVGWAISLRGGGLVAPAIHDVDRMSLAGLMAALRDLVQRARTGGLRSSELTDPTVTVTSLGERGAESVLGVIYPPQVAIIGFGRIVTRPWIVDGAVVARPVLSASLAADHRASDGHLGGRLLAAIDAALQRPDQL